MYLITVLKISFLGYLVNTAGRRILRCKNSVRFSRQWNNGNLAKALCSGLGKEIPRRYCYQRWRDSFKN